MLLNFNSCAAGSALSGQSTSAVLGLELPMEGFTSAAQAEDGTVTPLVTLWITLVLMFAGASPQTRYELARLQMAPSSMYRAKERRTNPYAHVQ